MPKVNDRAAFWLAAGVVVGIIASGPATRYPVIQAIAATAAMLVGLCSAVLSKRRGTRLSLWEDGNRD